MRQVRNRIIGLLCSAAARYWVQARYIGSEEFCVHHKFGSSQEARNRAAAMSAEGAYAEVMMQSIDNGRQIARSAGE
jgi:hypothetical protein